MFYRTVRRPRGGAKYRDMIYVSRVCSPEFERNQYQRNIRRSCAVSGYLGFRTEPLTSCNLTRAENVDEMRRMRTGKHWDSPHIRAYFPDYQNMYRACFTYFNVRLYEKTKIVFVYFPRVWIETILLNQLFKTFSFSMIEK